MPASAHHHGEGVVVAAEASEPDALVKCSGGVVAFHAEAEPLDSALARFVFQRAEQSSASSPAAVTREDGSADLGCRLVDKAIARRARTEVPPPDRAERFGTRLGDDAEVAWPTEAVHVARELGGGERLLE